MSTVTSCRETEQYNHIAHIPTNIVKSPRMCIRIMGQSLMTYTLDEKNHIKAPQDRHLCIKTRFIFIKAYSLVVLSGCISELWMNQQIYLHNFDKSFFYHEIISYSLDYNGWL